MLRDYQDWAVQEVWRYFAEREHPGNPVIAMPVGTGKSHVITGLALAMLRAFPTTRIMVLTHVKELIAQNFDKFIKAWPNAPVGIYSAGLNKKEHHFPITFAGIASVAKKASLFGHIDVVFVDECDLISPSEKTMYKKFFNDLRKKNPNLKIVGLTATPWRAGMGLITGEDGLFDDIAVDMTGVDAFNWFVDEGYLIPLVPKPTKLELDVSGVHMRGGEFIAAELQTAVDKIHITRKALNEACEVGANRHKWLVFASGVEHAQHVAEELCQLGIPSAAVYSGMGDSERDQVIKDFKAGKLRAVVNNNILTTGFDEPGIDFILMLRPTGSSRLWVQMLGRGTRPLYADGFDLSTKAGRLAAIAASYKLNTLVMDFAANIRKLGPINDPVIPKPKGKGPPGVAPVKLCDHCNTYNHATVKFCGGKPVEHPEFDRNRGCGMEFIFQTKLKIEASTEALVKGKIDLPIVQSFKVDHMTYNLHVKAGSFPMMRVTYYCGLKNFTEYVCLEHPPGNYARKRAREWWALRSSVACPEKTDEALDNVGSLAIPTHIEVWVNQKYPTIQNVCFDGSDFGRNQPADAMHTPIPTYVATQERSKPADTEPSMEKPKDFVAYAPGAHDDWDAEIPF